jgi:hypothetical protein
MIVIWDDAIDIESLATTTDRDVPVVSVPHAQDMGVLFPPYRSMERILWSAARKMHGPRRMRRWPVQWKPSCVIPPIDTIPLPRLRIPGPNLVPRLLAMGMRRF